MNRFAELDLKYVWHPFAQMRDWMKKEPIVIAKGRGATLEDVHGRRYLDANSSIWTNLHGHQHPSINKAIRRQMGRIAHSSALGFANEPASLLAEQLIQAANPRALFRSSQAVRNARHQRPLPVSRNSRLTKVFYSDDGSTAMEVALKLSYEFTRRVRPGATPRFLSLESAYHGDTIGAVSLGHMELFHKAYSGLLFGVDKVMAPYCYRCPYNRARPQRADAREYRRCNWECVDEVEQAFAAAHKQGNPYTAMVVEPRIQGVAGMIAHPAGWLERVAERVRAYGAQLIADEVMTGFGRTGPLFACHAEKVQPDFLAVAKGMTGGYLPMAATLTTQAVFDVFLGEYEEFKTFFHGHSFTGNQLGAAASLANLERLRSGESIKQRSRLQSQLQRALNRLWESPHVGDVRQVGGVAGVELVRDPSTREPFDLHQRAGIRVCEAMANRGVLTRPIGNVVVIMPPYCTTERQVQRIIGALHESIRSELEGE